MNEAIEICVNGEVRKVECGTSVAQLVAALGFEPKTLLIEYNREPLPRDRWPTTALAADDSLELFRVSAGG
jgi:sulfur carrier protein